MPETPFLTARWSNLCLVTFRVPTELVASYLPSGLEPDTWEGSALASLVAFDFLDTRVLGIPWPGFRDFPEINLRVYARQGERRGVVFVREFVPQAPVAWVARALYNEPYSAARIEHFDRSSDQFAERTTELYWAGSLHRLTVRARKPARMAAKESLAHFLKEHRWGFGRGRSGEGLVYKVLHPLWEDWPVEECRLEWDWGRVYGDRWAFLAEATPVSVIYALGSRVAVFPKGRL